MPDRGQAPLVKLVLFVANIELKKTTFLNTKYRII